jgi:hypothetical protein
MANEDHDLEWTWQEDPDDEPGRTHFIYNNANGLTVFIDQVYVLRAHSLQDAQEFYFADKFGTLDEAKAKGEFLMANAIEEFEHGLPELK